MSEHQHDDEQNTAEPGEDTQEMETQDPDATEEHDTDGATEPHDDDVPVPDQAPDVVVNVDESDTDESEPTDGAERRADSD